MGSKKIGMPMIHKEILTFKEKFIYAYGGRGGGKSQTIARCVVLLCGAFAGIEFLVTRKTLPSLKISAMRDILDVIAKYEIPGEHHITDHYFEFQNKSRIYFLPLYTTQGRNERLKSISLNGVWIEEPTECSKQDFDSLFPAIRRPGIHKWFFTFNPPESSEHWLYKNYERQVANNTAKKIHFDIEDNPLLPDDVKQELYDLKEIDHGLYLRFTKGEWGIDVKRKRVWQNILEGVMSEIPDVWMGGIDFGWNKPSSSHLYGIFNQEIYMHDEVYETHLQSEDLGKKIFEMIDRNNLNAYQIKFIADSEAPEKIKVLQDMGLNVIGADKAKGSVEAGIVEVRKHKVYVNPDCPNGWRELTNYVYPEKPDGTVSEIPVDFNNHSCDELRYMTYYYFRIGRMNQQVEKPETVNLQEANWR